MGAEPLAVLNELVELVRQDIPENRDLYLVGGAVRDAVLGKPSHDLDFVTGGDPRPLAKRTANRLRGAYFLLDDERNTARVILSGEAEKTTVLDFSALRGKDLETDLRARDFSINAMAVDVRAPQNLIDPLGGLKDLRDRKLSACAPDSIAADPVRILRAVRMALAFELAILPDTREQIRANVALLPRVSMERRRDELFKTLDGPRPAGAIRALDQIGALGSILPELSHLKGVTQSLPHTADVWTHTLDVVRSLEQLLDALDPTWNPEKSANLSLGMASLVLGRYRGPIGQYLQQTLNPQRSHRSLLILAALYHDIAKPETWEKAGDGRIHNYGHENQGADVVEALGRSLLLSNVEIDRLVKIVRNHMRIHLVANTGEAITRRAIYRFFRDTGDAGVDVCLLTLADTLGTYGPSLPAEVWRAHLETCRALLAAYWETPVERVSPPVLVDGNDLQAAFGLRPGPVIGRLLEAIREEQAEGLLGDREAALVFAREWLKSC